MKMASIHFVQPDGAHRCVEARHGISLMHAAIEGNIHGIQADCGGCLSCATCHVYVEGSVAACIPSPQTDELGMLEAVAAPRAPNSRLSCQVVVTQQLDGLTVRIPAFQS